MKKNKTSNNGRQNATQKLKFEQQEYRIKQRSRTHVLRKDNQFLINLSRCIQTMHILKHNYFFSGVRVNWAFVLCVCFVDRCLAFLSFFYWSLCCLSFFDLRIVVTPLVSSNSSYSLYKSISMLYLDDFNSDFYQIIISLY